MILDANVIVAASLGRSLPLVDGLLERGFALLVPEAQLREAWLVTGRVAAEQERDAERSFAWAWRTLLPIPEPLYVGKETEARKRLRQHGQPDWPLVALALASGDDVWSNDLDLFGTGIVTWNTFNIERATPRALASDQETGTDHG